MVRCIFCGVEIEGSVKEHLIKYHFAAAPPTLPEHPHPLPAETPPVVPTPAITPKSTTQLTAETEKTEKPKRRYLTGTEIITLLQNTNKVFNANELQGCPLTKEDT